VGSNPASRARKTVESQGNRRFGNKEEATTKTWNRFHDGGS
jgi:hypothetical protein